MDIHVLGARLFNRLLKTTGASVVVILLSAVRAAADAAPPIIPGDPVGVPTGPVADVFIEHEQLSMDLVALASYGGGGDARLAVVDARYALRNDGAARRIDLVFVTASSAVPDNIVLFDGVPVASVTGTLGPVPASWMPPAGTPPLGSGPDIPYQIGQAAAITFHVDMGAGRHTLETQYKAAPTQYSGDQIAGESHYWQIAFVLAPARQWGGFGDLDLTVRVPTGWQAAVRPALRRQGDLLAGHFTGIPADAIAVTTRYPVHPLRSTVWSWVVGLAAVLVLALMIGLALGRAAGWYGFLALLFSPTLALIPATVVGFAAGDRFDAIPPGQASWFGAKGLAFDWLGEVVLALAAGFVIALAGLAIGATVGMISRRGRRRPLRMSRDASPD